MDFWSILTERWPWLTPFVALLMALLGLRKTGIHPWSWLIGQLDLRRELERVKRQRDNCREDLASSEASAAMERRLKENAIAMVQEWMALGQRIKQEAGETGTLPASEPSSRKPAP